MKTLVFAIALLAATPAIAAAAITSQTPWSRPAIATGVVYLTLRNTGATPDRLVKITSPVAKTVELHESMESTMAMGNVTSMRPVASIAIPAHGSARLAPGGYHAMLIGLIRPLRAGETFPIRLYFAHARPQAATVRVQAP